MAEIKNVEIFGVGTWNGFKFVADDLQELVDNSNKMLEKVRARLKLGHNEKQPLDQSDGQPAFGQVINFRVEGDKIIADFVKMPDVIHQAIEKELFLSVSSELYFIENFGWYIKAVALLGADIPAVKTIDDLQAFLSEDSQNQSSSNGISLNFSEPSIVDSSDFKNEKKEVKEMSDNTDSKALELEKKILELERERNELKSQVSNFGELERERVFSEKKTAFLAPYKKQVEAGRLKPAMFAKLELSVDQQQKNFSEDQEIMLPANLVDELAQAYSESMPQGEQAGDSAGGNTGVPIDERIVNETKQVMAKTGLNFSEASELVFSSQPNLAKEYHEYTCKVHDSQ